LLVLRLVMLAVAAIFTPQAASTIALIVTEKERPSAISFVFLGWSLSVAIGLPLVTFSADHFSWRITYGAIGAAAGLVFLLTAMSIPVGLRGEPLSLKSWGTIARNRLIVLLLAITTLWMSGQFTIFPYLGPLLAKLADATPQVIAAFFALMGVTGFIGNVIATRVVRHIGAFNTSLIFLLSLLAGAVVWSLGAGSLPIMGAAVTLLGLGFAALNSMQQARLVAAKPDLSSAAVALNTSSIYIGQAIGSAFGGFLLAHDLPRALGYSAVVLMATSLGVLALTRDTPAVAS
jgi:predicted MFS family arabinose efflux permease